jgi:hypothetical protein
VQIILFRPVLLHILETDTTNCDPAKSVKDIEAAVQNETCRLIGSLCIQNAQELVHVIAQNLEARTEFLPPWWYTIFCEDMLKLF